jgi:protein SCO1/2
LIHQGVINLLKELTLTLGDDYTVATISFDPTETTAQALEHAQIYRSQYADPEKAARGWEFFVGEEVPVKTLLNEVGFYYKKDGEEYAHSAAIFILTPEGKISQYFTGIEFPPFDVKLALLEAAQGQIGTPLDHILLFCFRFDDTKGRYTLAAYNTMRAGGALTLMFLVLVIGTQIVRERRKKRMDSMRSGKL